MPLNARSYKGPIKKLSGSSNHGRYNTQFDSVDIVAFDREGEEWGIFSNYAEIPIKMQTPFGEKTFPTVEHYFQYQKDPNDKAYLERILQGDAQNARDLGQKKRWSDFKLADQAMQRAIQEKLKNPLVRRALKDTGNACLIEDTGSRSSQNQDGNWGWKTGGSIEPHATTGNKLGILLMEERNRLHRQEGNFSMIVQNPRDLSERARGIMTRNYSNKNLIHLSLPVVSTIPTQASYPSSRMKDSLNQTKKHSTQESHHEVSQMIRTMMTTSSPSFDIPFVGKGQMNGTFKIAFDNPKDAAAFQDMLAKQGFKTSYFGDSERYPMEHSGKKLNHIVRFENSGTKTEIPEKALQFLKEKFNDDAKVANIVENMGFERPKMGVSMHM
ncbi:NADAR family protein [Legionella bozemanae]|uniref:NADAR family protein n=1 Tax=Legionella bozemanae TaxID=447 RepID=UPI00399C5D64